MLFPWDSLSPRQISLLIRAGSPSPDGIEDIALHCLLSHAAAGIRLDFQAFLAEVERDCGSLGGAVRPAVMRKRMGLLQSVVLEAQGNALLTEAWVDARAWFGPGRVVLADLTDMAGNRSHTNALFQVLLEQFRASGGDKFLALDDCDT